MEVHLGLEESHSSFAERTEAQGTHFSICFWDDAGRLASGLD